ncbi:hypothetical protein ACHAXR_001130 [Thalassiosira sp. AJA248-18]
MKFVKRRTKNDPKSTDGDEESQSSSPAITPRTRPSAPSSGNNASGAGGIGGLLRKFIMLAAADVQGSEGNNYLLTIIKDVISGTILGVFFLMILIFLDYRNIVQLGSARAFRRAAFELMTDPETVKNIEENIEIKFIPVDVYKSMTEEITRNKEKVGNDSSLKQHEDDYLKRRKEIEDMKVEYEAMKEKGNSVLKLDKWCGGCKGGWGNCDGRIKYLVDTYHTPEIKAKVDIMKTGKCMNP